MPCNEESQEFLQISEDAGSQANPGNASALVLRNPEYVQENIET